MADGSSYQSKIIVGSENGNIRKEYGIKSVEYSHSLNMISCNVKLA